MVDGFKKWKKQMDGWMDTKNIWIWMEKKMDGWMD